MDDASSERTWPQLMAYVLCPHYSWCPNLQEEIEEEVWKREG